MDSVKQQKLEMMKNIKRLQNTKASLTKTQQAKRDEYQTTKAKLEKDMQRLVSQPLAPSASLPSTSTDPLPRAPEDEGVCTHAGPHPL
jgi:hypothetical protein